jgi:hypothetical protein
MGLAHPCLRFILPADATELTPTPYFVQELFTGHIGGGNIARRTTRKGLIVEYWRCSKGRRALR